MPLALAVASTVSEACDWFATAPTTALVRHPLDSQANHNQSIDLIECWTIRRWNPIVDFRTDARYWHGQEMQSLIREVLLGAIGHFYMGGHAAVQNLAPIIDHAPKDDERLLLGTQIADEVVHEIFWERFMRDVVRLNGDYDAMTANLPARYNFAFKAVIDQHLPQAVDDLRRNPNPSTWVTAVVVCHAIVKGYLGYVGEVSIRRVLDTIPGKLSAFSDGFTALCRDASGHVALGRLALRRRIYENPELARVVGLKLAALGGVASRATKVHLFSQSSSSTVEQTSLQAAKKLGQMLWSVGFTDKAAAVSTTMFGG